jgi:hypothetical protein
MVSTSLARSRVRLVIGSCAPVIIGALLGACRTPGDDPAEFGPEQPTVVALQIAPRDVPEFFTMRGRDTLDASAYRQQWNDVRDWSTVAEWARDPDHRGRLYVVGEAVHDSSKYADDPALFARDYCAFVRGVRAVDGMAQFSPGLIEDWVSEDWLTGFANALLGLARGGSCSFNPVSEWEFAVHPPRWSNGLVDIEAYVDRKAAWATAQRSPLNAPMVLAWTLDPDGAAEDDSAYVNRVREFKAWLFAHDDVIGSRYLGTPGPAFAGVTARIAGAKLVHPSAACVWVVETTGGSEPYAFKWLMNGATVSTSPAISVKSESGFLLELIAADRSGGASRAKLRVETSLDAPPCL